MQRTFHRECITVELAFEEHFYTAAELEGLTLAGLHFRKLGTLDRVPLRDVPPRLFSEAMRDMDLVVSVAHQSGVDPQPSESTIESRAALLRETCALLKLANVRVEPPRAFIEGTRANYTLHLGSATVHRAPGGMLFVVPVHSQHRGRVFLPFADNDPRTAEVITLAITLARDAEIKDPSILQQLRP